jgi:hypothetical protein
MPRKRSFDEKLQELRLEAGRRAGQVVWHRSLWLRERSDCDWPYLELGKSAATGAAIGDW